MAAGCQTYEPRPLEPERHREAFHARTLEYAALATRLEGLSGDRDALLESSETFDADDGLSLFEGQLVARAFHPSLRLARLQLARAVAGMENSELWIDPVLSLEVLRITQSVPDRWVVTPGLAFTLPVSGRLKAAGQLAETRADAARLSLLEAEWRVQSQVQIAWSEWSAAVARLEESELYLAALAPLARTTAQLAEQGELLPTEAALFSIKEARHRNQRLTLSRRVTETEIHLRAALGLAPEAPVTFLPELARPAEGASDLPEPADAQTALFERNPTLARLRAGYEVAEQALNFQIRKQYPDLTLGPLLESDAGQSRIGLLAGLPLPFLNANRRAIAQATVAREIARAQYETGYETLARRLAGAEAEARALREQRDDMRTVLLPLVETQLTRSLELLRLGENPALVALESLAAAHETRHEFIDMELENALASIELLVLIGPPASTTSGTAQAPQ